LYFIYRYYYKLIANANMIIENIDKAEGPEADKKIIKGQALAYRAWAHHQLVQLFAERYDLANLGKPGVVLMTKFTTVGQPRATIGEVYNQINKDVEDAIALLDGYNRGDALKKSHININVAKGLKARIALSMGDWANAAKYASEARQNLSLMSNAQYKEGFNSVTNPEWMWGSYQLDDQQTYFYSFFAYMSANFNSTNIRTNPKAINSKLYGLIPATDVRKQMWDPTGASIPVPPNGAKKPYANKKFLAKSSSLSVGDVPYMRVAEMYLIEAEAKARLGQADAADVLFTLVKNRDAAYVKSLKTGQELVEEILIQRRIELWGEGFRFFDLKRTNTALDRTGANHDPALTTTSALTKPADSKEWVFLIPQAEMNANKAMTQNEL
jgi:starch-binding outer membrane protein, SusD/RagB family